MTPGRFIAVVGPSGVGKDSVMEGICALRRDLHRVRRVITRAPDAGGEAIESISPALFAAHAAGGDFALHWTAHGLSYGIPASVHEVLRKGRDVLANLSRSKLAEAAIVFPFVHVLHITASRDVLARRLSRRARETSQEIARRIGRAAPAIPDGLTVTEIDNSGPLNASIEAAMRALYPVRV